MRTTTARTQAEHQEEVRFLDADDPDDHRRRAAAVAALRRRGRRSPCTTGRLSTVTDAVDNLTQNIQNKPQRPEQPARGEPELPEYPATTRCRISQPQGRGRGAGLGEERRRRTRRTKAPTGWPRRRWTTAGGRKWPRNWKSWWPTRTPRTPACAPWPSGRGRTNGPTLLLELDSNNGLWQFDKAGGYVGDALVRLQYAPAAAVSPSTCRTSGSGTAPPHGGWRQWGRSRKRKSSSTWTARTTTPATRRRGCSGRSGRNRTRCSIRPWPT